MQTPVIEQLKKRKKENSGFQALYTLPPNSHSAGLGWRLGIFEQSPHEILIRTKTTVRPQNCLGHRTEGEVKKSVIEVNDSLFNAIF